jgi:ribonuclease P protein component
MLPRTNKLKSKKQIETVFRKGKRIHSENFLMSCYKVYVNSGIRDPKGESPKNLGLEQNPKPQYNLKEIKSPKFLVSIPKKHLKLSTDRKKISRRINSIIALNIEFSRYSNWNFMITSKSKNILQIHYQDLESEVIELFNSFEDSKNKPKPRR